KRLIADSKTMMLSRFKSLTLSVLLELGMAMGLALLMVGCNAIARTGGSGVVVSHTAQIRSSTAVVAADLLEVNRGDAVDILDSLDIPDPTDNTKKELWYRVRARDVEKTEGWIEARNIMPDNVLEKSRKLADEDKNIQPQGTGQLHASSNLRLTPDRSKDDNITMRLDSGSITAREWNSLRGAGSTKNRLKRVQRTGRKTLPKNRAQVVG